MSKRIYVGNLPYSITPDDLRQLFEQHGSVDDVTVISDRETGRSKGFGFVEMADASEADTAISALNGHEHDGRALTVNEAKPRASRGPGGPGGRY